MHQIYMTVTAEENTIDVVGKQVKQVTTLHSLLKWLGSILLKRNNLVP